MYGHDVYMTRIGVEKLQRGWVAGISGPQSLPGAYPGCVGRSDGTFLDTDLYDMYHLYRLYLRFHKGGHMAREKISAAKAREEFSDLVSRAAYAKERHVVTRRGKAVAAMVPIEDLELLEELEDRIDVIEGLQALAEAQEQGTKSWEEVRAELGL